MTDEENISHRNQLKCRICFLKGTEYGNRDLEESDSLPKVLVVSLEVWTRN